MTQKTTAFAVLILLTGLGFLAGSFFSGFFGGFFGQLTVPASHRVIVQETKVKATINAQAGEVELSSSLVENGNQEIIALDTYYIANKAEWISQKYDYTLWKWTYKGETLVFMRVWGPKNRQCLVEFSKLTMSPVYIDVAGTTHEFPLGDITFGGIDAYWWLIVTVT